MFLLLLFCIQNSYESFFHVLIHSTSQNFVYSKKPLMRNLSFTFGFQCLLLVSLSHQIVCFKEQSSQLFIFTNTSSLYRLILSPYAYDRTDSFFLTVISLLIYISIGLITLLTKMRIMNWYTGKS